MRDWRHWFKRDALIPASILVLAGFALVWLAQKLMPLLRDPDLIWLLYTFLTSIAVYLLFALISIRHILSTYTLERFDPGHPESVKRLSKMSRFNFPASSTLEGPFGPYLQKAFEIRGFQEEANHPVIGHALLQTKPSKLPWILPDRHERIFIVERHPLNVFIVDFTIRDTLRYLADQVHTPSDHNLLIFITHEPQLLEAASAAAGVVNFLGKTEEGTLGTLFLDCQNSRLYFPIDQTLISFGQRHHLSRMRKHILDVIAPTQHKKEAS
ncbi:MAG: hypothetical protein PHC86_00490 [Eubacteriales bacterium]|nr:hypothetical protein [Eubacteriales bacterium]